MVFDDDIDLVFDMSFPGAECRADLREINEEENTVATVCRLSRDAETLRICVEASDDDMLGLLATAPIPGQIDRFLYEEDVIQLAIARPQEAVVRNMLLVNPLGNACAAGEASQWDITTSRHAEGWVIEVTIPVPADQLAIGLSLHRFYRGVKNEVHGLMPTLPHPLDPEEFAVVVLQPGAGAAKYHRSMLRAKETHLQSAIDQAHNRLAKRQPLPAPWLELATTLAEGRSSAPLDADPRFLSWNEGHFQHALLNLWQLTGARRWLETSITRQEKIWEFTGDHSGVPDKVWGFAQPTWYDERDELGAAICLTTGVIIYPMARLLHTVWTDVNVTDLRPRLEPWFDRCRRAIAVHDREWVELPGESGAYLEPYVKGPRRVYPNGGSRIAPLNRMFFLAMPMLMLGRLLNDEIYIDRVRKMARFFRESLEECDNGGVVWEYETAYYPATGEDISHAACQVRFAELCNREGIEFSENDLEAMAVTLRENIFVHGDVPCEEVRGLTPNLNMAVGAWSSLCRFVPDVLPRIEAVIETAFTERPQFFAEQGWGIYLLTEVEKARRGIR